MVNTSSIPEEAVEAAITEYQFALTEWLSGGAIHPMRAALEAAEAYNASDS